MLVVFSRSGLSIRKSPVQLEDEVVRYRIGRNKAVAVISQGHRSAAEAQRIKDEPAYAN